MSKQETDITYIKTELERLHPEDGDVFVFNVASDDPTVIYSDDIIKSVDDLSNVLYELTGLNIPIIVLGEELNIELMDRDTLIKISKQIDDALNDESIDDEYIDELDVGAMYE